MRPVGAVGTCPIEVLGFYLVLVDVVSLKNCSDTSHLTWTLEKLDMVIVQLHVLSIHSSKFFAYYSRLLMLSHIMCVQKYRLAKYIPEISEGTFRNASHVDDAD
jgi:hypothetical protein